RSPVVLTGHADASWVDDLAMQRSSQGYTFSLGSGSVSWRSTCSSSVLSSSFLYVDNKAMLALCREHRLEHRTKHIALRYFLARELRQRGQLRLAYVASQANTADIFTKALQPCDHQRFCTKLEEPWLGRLQLPKPLPQTNHLPVLRSNGDPHHCESLLHPLHGERHLLYRVRGLPYLESALGGLHLQPHPL
ncbi:unnamed protein product, partial [Closterium sp. NIES-54]